MVRLSDRSRQLIHWCTASLFRLWAQGLIMILKLRFRRDFEAEVWSVFCCWCLVEVKKLNLVHYSEASFGQDFKFMFGRDTDICLRFEVNALLRFWNCNFIKICARTFDMNSTLGSVVPLAMFAFWPGVTLKPYQYWYRQAFHLSGEYLFWEIKFSTKKLKQNEQPFSKSIVHVC